MTPLPPRGSWSLRAAWRLVLARRLAAHRRTAIVQHRVAHGDLNVLAATGRHALIEGGENSHGAQHAGAGVADRRARPDGGSVGKAVDAHRLCDHVKPMRRRVYHRGSPDAGSPARPTIRLRPDRP
jgi:hypothetical protein